MRKFTLLSLSSMGRNRENPPYMPFPGKIPIRMLIQVKVVEALKGRQATRYFYHGKWSYEAYVAALRVFRSLSPEIRSSVVFEYHRSSILYSGNLEVGVYAANRNRILYSQNYPPLRIGPFQTYFVAPGYPLRVGGIPFLCLDKIDGSDTNNLAAIKNSCLRQYKVGIGVLRHAFDQ